MRLPLLCFCAVMLCLSGIVSAADFPTCSNGECPWVVQPPTASQAPNVFYAVAYAIAVPKVADTAPAYGKPVSSRAIEVAVEVAPAYGAPVRKTAKAAAGLVAKPVKLVAKAAVVPVKIVKAVRSTRFIGKVGKAVLKCPFGRRRSSI